MNSYKSFLIEEAKRFHLDNNIPIYESIFRYGSGSYFALIENYRQNMNSMDLSQEEIEFLSTDIGSFGVYEGKEVPLDLPLEENDVELNSPKRGGKKKFYVYVRNEKGNIIKVEFGDTSGLNAKINNPEARKSFAARHRCAEKKDKTTPGYWACRIPRYAKQLGLSGGNREVFW